MNDTAIPNRYRSIAKDGADFPFCPIPEPVKALWIPDRNIVSSLLLDNVDHFLFHLMVDFSVAGKGTAAWGVTCQFTNEGLILENAVDDAGDGSSCHVTACHFVDGAYFFLAGQRVA